MQRREATALATQLRALRAGPAATALHHSAPPPAHGGRTDHFHAPRTVDELAALRLAHPRARLLAGSTDIGLWVTKQFRDLGDVLWIGAVQALRGIAWRGGDIDAAGPRQAEALVGPADTNLGAVPYTQLIVHTNKKGLI